MVTHFVCAVVYSAPMYHSFLLAFFDPPSGAEKTLCQFCPLWPSPFQAVAIGTHTCTALGALVGRPDAMYFANKSSHVVCFSFLHRQQTGLQGSLYVRDLFAHGVSGLLIEEGRCNERKVGSTWTARSTDHRITAAGMR